MNKIFDKIKNKLKNKFGTFSETKEVTIQKYKPIFITIDGNKHEGTIYNWCIANRLNCKVPVYLMDLVLEDKYIKDKDGIMYFISNILSVEWKLIEERVVEDNFKYYKNFITDKELKNN